MEGLNIREILLFIHQGVSLLGIFVILSGILFALYQYVCDFLLFAKKKSGSAINTIRLNLGRVLVLGLEFIIAADLIGTTTNPDYYAVGILASIVAIRTLLSYSLNRELMSLSKE